MTKSLWSFGIWIITCALIGLLLALGPKSAAQGGGGVGTIAPSAKATAAQSPKPTATQAQKPALVAAGAVQLGLLQLKNGFPDAAKESCGTFLKDHPDDKQASDCLDKALAQLAGREADAQARTLEQARSLLRLGKKAEAITAVTNISSQIRKPELANQAAAILREAGDVSWLDSTKQTLSQGGISWILDVAIALLLLALLYWVLKGLRALKRYRRAAQSRSLRLRTSWRVIPIQDTTNLQTASFVLSAYNSMKSNLSDSYNPVLVFVPVGGDKGRSILTWQRKELWKAGESYARSVAENLSKSETSKTGDWWKSLVAWYKRWFRPRSAPPKPEGFLELQQQDFEFFDAVKQLGVSVGGTSLQGIGSFVAGIGKWFDAGIPTLAGSAFLDANNSNQVVVSLTCSEASRFTTVTAQGSGSNCASAQEAAQEAVYKMLYLLGHQNSTAADADIAATVGHQKRVVERCLNGKGYDKDDKLDAVCTTLADVREQIALSSSIPKYLVDRCLMWEAAARFLRAKDGDLAQVLELLQRLRSTEEKSQNDYYIYNAAVAQHQLGRPKETHDLLFELGKVAEPLKTVVLFAKIRLLADPNYQNIWRGFKEDVQAWKTEILEFAVKPPPVSSDEFSATLEQIRPSDTMIWNTILAAELDCPLRRPSENKGDTNRSTLATVQEFFQNEVAKPSADLANVYLQLARVNLFLGKYAEARDLSKKSQQESETQNAVQLYVEAEATYSDESLGSARIALARKIIQPMATDLYRPLQALKEALGADDKPAGQPALLGSEFKQSGTGT